MPRKGKRQRHCIEAAAKSVEQRSRRKEKRDCAHSFEVIRPGKKRDGNWTNEKQAEQLEKCIPLFKKVHPDCDLLFAFDNSQNHHARAPDALVASRLNLNDGGKNTPIMRDTKFKKRVDGA